jgi:hypothetical protein
MTALVTCVVALFPNENGCDNATEYDDIDPHWQEGFVDRPVIRVRQCTL